MCKWEREEIQISNLHVFIQLYFVGVYVTQSLKKYHYYLPKFPFCEHPHAKGTKSLTNNFNIRCLTIYCLVVILDGNKIQVVRQPTCVYMSIYRVRITC